MNNRGVIICCAIAFLAGVNFLFSETPSSKPQTPEALEQSDKPIFPEGRRVFLTKKLASEIDSFARVENDKSWGGAAIRVGGRAFQRGLGVHSDSKLVFQLGGEFATFNVVAGPDDAHHGQIEMKILVDGEEKWSSGPTRSNDKKHRRRLAISVKDAQTLTLLVLQSDENKGGDHASWANAYLERVPRKREPVAHATKLLEVKEKLGPFLRDYCIDCHGPDRQRGQVRFDTADWEINNNDIRENMPDYTIGTTMRGYLRKLQGPGEVTDPRAALWVDWMEIEGPFYPEKRPVFEEILYAGKETGHDSPYIWNDGKMRELIEKFAYEAFRRRTPDPEYIERLHQHYLENRAANMSPRNSFIEIMGIVLASPGFLFIQEDEANGDGREKLTDRELAIRLAYFLWSSPPDEELYAAAAGGSLRTEDNLEKQIERLLSDSRSERFRNGFIGQWAEFDRYDAITVDTREHYRFNEGVRQDAKQEVVEFFGALLEENLPARYLIDSDFAMLNGALDRIDTGVCTGAHRGIFRCRRRGSVDRKGQGRRLSSP